MRSLYTVLTIVIAMVIGTSWEASAMKQEQRESNKALLLVTFGTSIPEAQKAFTHIDEMARKAFPDLTIRWAYTSKIIRTKLAKEGKILDSPELALAKLMAEGYSHVAVLSLHVIPGEEFHALTKNTNLFSLMEKGFSHVLIAPPLLSSADDLQKVADAMLKHLPPSRKPNDAVIFMGHGSGKHPADTIYLAMNAVFSKKDPYVYLATVEGHPSLDEIIPELSAKKVKKVFLLPFMTVAGDHARNDMAGDDPASWKSLLTAKGFSCEAVMTGMAEYPEIVEIWFDHLREAIKKGW